MAAEAWNGSRPKHGVVFVHGLGEQPKSETLVLFGRALVEWTELWHAERGEKAHFAVETSNLGFSPYDAGGTTFQPHTRIRVQPSVGQPETWLLTEAWWSFSSLRPDFWQMLSHFTTYIFRATVALWRTVWRRIRPRWGEPDSTGPGLFSRAVDMINSIME